VRFFCTAYYEIDPYRDNANTGSHKLLTIAASYDESKLIADEVNQIAEKMLIEFTAEEENPISEQMLIQFTTEEQGENTLQKEHPNPVQS
jgi:hypothetical protein